MTSRETPDRMSFLLASQNVRCHMFGVVRTGDLYGADAQRCARRAATTTLRMVSTVCS